MKRVQIFIISCLILKLALGGELNSLLSLTAADKTAIVNSMNTLRNGNLSPTPREGTMKTIVWDNELEAWAKTYVQKCNWGHSPKNAGQRPSSVGENLYAKETYLSASTLITLAEEKWESEREWYTYEGNKCADGKVCGHYTVLIKDSNTGVGCAVAQCSTLPNSNLGSSTYVVCNYRAQNTGSVPYSIGLPPTDPPTDPPSTGTGTDPEDDSTLVEKNNAVKGVNAHRSGLTSVTLDTSLTAMALARAKAGSSVPTPSGYTWVYQLGTYLLRATTITVDVIEHKSSWHGPYKAYSGHNRMGFACYKYNDTYRKCYLILAKK